MSPLETALTALLAGCGAYLGSYLKAKGERRAEAESIRHITDVQETIRLQNSTILESLKGTQQLRMAAVDKRLEAHQRSFELWRAMVTSKPEHALDAIEVASDFWNQNCLYLEPPVRTAFVDALAQARIHQATTGGGADMLSMRLSAYDKLMIFPNVLFEAIKLPALSPAEKKFLDDKPPEETTSV